jgi:hypothetical protein
VRIAVYESLNSLHYQFGGREFGKLCQKLLAIAFQRAGFGHVVERGVQGVDVDAAGPGGKFSAEVKTTRSGIVKFEPKDVEGLRNRRRDGYHSLLAALRLSPLSDWIIANSERLEAGVLSFDRLRPYRRHDLEDQLRPVFAEVVAEHAPATMTGAQAYLDGVLRDSGIELDDPNFAPKLLAADRLVKV